MNNSEQLIALKESETAFLKYFNKADYELVDFSVVEKLDWKQLNHEDLQQMGERFGNMSIKFMHFEMILQINYCVITQCIQLQQQKWHTQV
ncbi:ATP phosphoribosyltransferase, regulatory subunit [Staphylococcus aureus]|nr:ATP phosphoribosyltransferase, regulatory subunit [Staphylococcus aureus]CAC7378689.1 ATP phosphoribosyltransferase, regulatory subunit [Staphylococcus aureus]CAC7388778.1 ATP phosphoribosyltransferase, regulatory subunit [Staphylococcus aureus]CAC7448798.1 ATP phosphoribosyltransferase, regulatory subunit [Staphylococcus aureus]CAC7459953.1 ATP phosphoribosyltransferase, regulatory subunit [Staphylococcus aureus]